MRQLFRLFLAALVMLALAGCGGGGSAGLPSNASTTTSTPTTVVTPVTTLPPSTQTYTFPLTGITFTLADRDSVYVPSGTTVTTTSGSATLSGNNGILYTGSSAVITVPANSGAATHLVSTAAPPTGAAYLGSPVMVPLIGSATTASSPRW